MLGTVSGVMVVAAFAAVAWAAGFVAVRLYRVSHRVLPGTPEAGAADGASSASEAPDA